MDTPKQIDTARQVIESHFRQHLDVTERTLQDLAGPIESAAEILVTALRAGGKILLFGNGGSMADAIHIEGELSGRFLFDRDPLPAIALATGASSLTAISNDLGFDQIFARQVRALAGPDDAVIAISTSGNSPNVLEGVRAALDLGATVIGLTGAGGGRLGEIAQCPLIIPTDFTPTIQENHILIGHILCRIVEQQMFGQD